MIEYMDWAKGQITPDHEPSIYDWQNMTLAEMSNRALAICDAARNAPASDLGDSMPIIYAFQCLEKMAEAMKEKYPYKTRGW